MFTFGAWLVGLVLGVSINVASEDEIVWWYRMVFGLALFPALFPLGMIFPRLTMGFTSGAMIGGGLALAISVFTTEWTFIPRSLAMLVVGFFCVSGQWARIDDVRGLPLSA